MIELGSATRRAMCDPSTTADFGLRWLTNEVDETRRHTVRRLLAEEEAKLAALENEHSRQVALKLTCRGCAMLPTAVSAERGAAAGHTTSGTNTYLTASRPPGDPPSLVGCDVLAPRITQPSWRSVVYPSTIDLRQCK